MTVNGIPPGWEGAVERMRAELERKAKENPKSVVTLEQISAAHDQEVCLSCKYGARMIGALKCGNLKSCHYKKQMDPMATCPRYSRRNANP